ncbi:MAG: transposase [Candidatus Aenigmatarchaeota archaeon]
MKLGLDRGPKTGIRSQEVIPTSPDPIRGFGKSTDTHIQDQKYRFDGRKDEERFELCCFARSVIYPELVMKQHHNAEYEPTQLLSVPTYAALTNDFVNDAVENHPLPGEETPHSNTVFYRIENLSVEEILGQFNSAMKRIIEVAVEEGALEGKVDIAIDITDWRYYGDRNDPMVVLTQPKKGTNRAFLLATVYVIVDGERFTLKAIPMGPFTSKEDILEDLLDYAEETVNIGTLYVDRAFFTVDCIGVLKRKDIKFLMPATKNGRVRKEAKKECPRIEEFEYGVNRKDPVTFNLAVVEDDEGTVRTFATNHDVEKDKLGKLFDMYSLRWGIETSYRVKHQFRAKTRTKKYEPRIFLFLFSVCLYNLWVLVNFQVARRFGADSKIYMTAKTFTKNMVDVLPEPPPIGPN